MIGRNRASSEVGQNRFGQTRELWCRVAAFSFIAIGVFARTAGAERLSFKRDVKPILASKCGPCHGKDAKEANLDLRTMAAIRRGGDSGSAFPDGTDLGVLWQRIESGDMPPEGRSPLTNSERTVIRKWLRAGAPAETPQPRSYGKIGEQVSPAVVKENTGLRETEPMALLQDVNFAEGFGAAFIYGRQYSGGRRPPIGEVLEYRDIAPWQIFLIPDGPVKKVGVKTHPWDFQEGYHANFKDGSGRLVRELHAHRLVVNHRIEENSNDRLQFAQFNNDQRPAGHPDRDTKLVKRVTTDRKGTLRLYYNSQNEIRNAATGHSARWARDTWPHFLVNQRMLKPIPIKDFERLDFHVSFQVDRMNKLSNWPNAIRGAARSGMNLKFMFFLRNPKSLEQKLFAGMMLYASNEKRYAPHLGIEQHGNIFYRDSVTRGDATIPKLSERRMVSVDIRELVAEALRQGRLRQPELSSRIDDYSIYNFSIGFEGMGHWETEAEISDLSLIGAPRQHVGQP